MKIATPLLLISLTLASIAQTPDQPAMRTSFSRIERIGEANARSFFMFSIGDWSYTIRHDGRGEIRSPGFLHPRYLDLKMGGGRLERLYYAELSGDLLLAYEVTSGKSGWGHILRVDQNQRARWIAAIPSRNINPGTIENNFVYLSGQDFLAKMDLASGKYVWQQADFAKEYDKSFFEFSLPEINGANVVFPELGSSSRVLELEKMTGKILKVEKREQ